MISPFDALADRYDAAFTRTPVGAVLRRMVWSRLDELFAPGERVLELGCGTGADALYLARRGVEVVAIDASEKMIDVARRKTSDHPGLTLRTLRMEEIGVAFRAASFDGCFSNFGAVNCVDTLPALVDDVAALLKPRGKLCWVLMGKHVPWEWAWFLARGEWGKAWRRYRTAEWRGLRVQYPQPRQVKALLARHFSAIRVRPLGCVLPPSYAARWLNRSPRALSALTLIEQRIAPFAMWAAVSDHYIVEAWQPIPQISELKR